MAKHVVELTADERLRLQELVKHGKNFTRRHAQILLKSDEGPSGPAWSDAKIAEAFDCHVTTIENIRRRLVEKGLDAALEHGRRGSTVAKKLDGRAEAYLIALTRMDPPEGHRRWGVRLLASEMVARGYVDSCSRMTVHRTLKKMNFSLT